MKIIIVGGGHLGESLAALLIREKHEVVMVEKDERTAEELAEKLDALVLHGDGTEKNILDDADVTNSDVLVAMTSDDQVNLAVCRMAKEEGVPNVIARINNAENDSLFSKADVSNLINTTSSAVADFRKAIERPGKTLARFVSGGKAEIFEVMAREGSEAAGKTVEEVSKGFVIASVYRNGEVLVPKADTRVRKDDVLTICVPLSKAKGIEGLFEAKE